MSQRSWPIPGLQALFVAAFLAVAPQLVLAGSGYFIPHPTTPVFGSVGSRAIAMGDIDGDGDLDILAARFGVDTVWRNDGTGIFSAHPTPSFGAGNTNSIALGDIDGDGDLDAVVGNGTGEAETVWLNNGAGVFSAHPTVPSFGAGSTTFVALRDLDGDGDLDAIAVNTAGQATTVWLNNGAGVFTSHPVTPSFGAGGTKMYAALGDLDSDGDIDVVLVDSAASQSVWLNDGAGSFSPHPSGATFGPTGAFAIALGDIDGDGDLDAVVPTVGAERVYLNDGTGLFTAHPTTPLFGSGTSVSLALADIDGDGDLDAIVSNLLEPNTTWLNDGAGNFSPHPTLPSFGTGSKMAVLGDIDGDGDLDVVLADGGGGEAVWLNPSTFAIATAVTPAGAGSVTCTDNPVLEGGNSTCTYTANAGYTFDNWSGDCAGATCTLTSVTSAKSVTANFTAITYAIATAVSPGGSGTVACTPNPVAHGSGSTCTATPNAGFAFVGWSGDCVGATCTLTNVTSARSVTASFSAATYAISTAVNPAGAGTVSCTPNPVGHAGSATCTATANAGFTFTAWSGDCAGATCTLTNVTAARSVTANFTIPNRTFSGPSATGSGTIGASFTTTDATCAYGTTQFIAPPPGSPPVPPTSPGSVVFPHGLFDFTVIACAPGATVNLTITYPTPLPPGTLYWKYGPEPGNAVPHWYVMPSTIAGNTATFSITDGGQGDDDLTANGTIVDQGGPGFPPGGGPFQTPTLSQWALILLASLMLVAGWAGYPPGKGRRPGHRVRV